MRRARDPIMAATLTLPPDDHRPCRPHSLLDHTRVSAHPKQARYSIDYAPKHGTNSMGGTRVAERSDEEVIVAISVHVADPRDRVAELVSGVLPRGIDEDAGRDGRSSAHARFGEQGDGDENYDRGCQANEAGAMHEAPPTRQGWIGL